MKKVLITLLGILIIISLSACTGNENNPVKNDTTTISLYKGDYVELLGEETLEKLYINDLSLKDNEVSVLGTKLPGETFTDYNGKSVTLPKGAYIFEVVGSWCTYCQALTNETLEELVKTGYPVYLYFLEGTKKDVESFFETIGIEIPTNVTILLMNSSFEEYLDENDFFNIPLSIVVDETGNIGLTHIGYSEVEIILEFVKLGMEGKYYNVKVDGMLLADYIRIQKIAKDYISNLTEIDIPSELLK